MNLQDIVDWFNNLKDQGVSREEVLDVLEFDSDQYPDMDLLKEARDIVYPVAK